MKPWTLLQRVCRHLLNDHVRPLARRIKLQEQHPTCRFHPGCYVDDKTRLGKFHVLFEGAILIDSELGDHTYVQKGSMLFHATVGKYGSIAMNAAIGLPQHATGFVSSHPSFYLADTPLVKTYSPSDMFSTTVRTHVGHDVWVGQNVMIMGGVTIGSGAVIGAGSVVTKDVPDYAVVAGVPANVVKYRFEEETRRALLDSRWWDLPEGWIEKNYRLFADPQQLLASLNRSS